MKYIYFVRHAESDYSVHDDVIRPLTAKGIKDSKKVTDFFRDKNINKIFSSPYKRTFDTVKHYAESKNMKITLVDNFRERKISDAWIDDFNEFSRNQWFDFDYKLINGESLNEVQMRNINALNDIIHSSDSEDEIVIGTHGTALSTILNHYDKSFDFKRFSILKPKMPYIVCIEYADNDYVGIQEIDL